MPNSIATAYITLAADSSKLSAQMQAAARNASNAAQNSANSIGKAYQKGFLIASSGAMQFSRIAARQLRNVTVAGMGFATLAVRKYMKTGTGQAEFRLPLDNVSKGMERLGMLFTHSKIFGKNLVEWVTKFGDALAKVTQNQVQDFVNLLERAAEAFIVFKGITIGEGLLKGLTGIATAGGAGAAAGAGVRGAIEGWDDPNVVVKKKALAVAMSRLDRANMSVDRNKERWLKYNITNPIAGRYASDKKMDEVQQSLTRSIARRDAAKAGSVSSMNEVNRSLSRSVARRDAARTEALSAAEGLNVARGISPAGGMAPILNFIKKAASSMRYIAVIGAKIVAGAAVFAAVVEVLIGFFKGCWDLLKMIPGVAAIGKTIGEALRNIGKDMFLNLSNFGQMLQDAAHFGPGYTKRLGKSYDRWMGSKEPELTADQKAAAEKLARDEQQAVWDKLAEDGKEGMKALQDMWDAIKEGAKSFKKRVSQEKFDFVKEGWYKEDMARDREKALKDQYDALKENNKSYKDFREEFFKPEISVMPGSELINSFQEKFFTGGGEKKKLEDAEKEWRKKDLEIKEKTNTYLEGLIREQERHEIERTQDYIMSHGYAT